MVSPSKAEKIACGMTGTGKIYTWFFENPDNGYGIGFRVFLEATKESAAPLSTSDWYFPESSLPSDFLTNRKIQLEIAERCEKSAHRRSPFEKKEPITIYMAMIVPPGDPETGADSGNHIAERAFSTLELACEYIKCAGPSLEKNEYYSIETFQLDLVDPALEAERERTREK